MLDFNGRHVLDGVRILLLDVGRFSDDQIFELGRLLSPKELRKAARFRQTKDRRVYLAGRGMLRKIAAEILAVNPRELEIEEGRYGKPYFRDFSKLLSFNLSNSGETVALAIDFAHRHIGIDVEKIDRQFKFWETAGYYFSAAECDKICTHRDFYRYWTKKEALLKATGAGLVEKLHLIDLSGRLNRIEATDERLIPFKNSSFNLFTLENAEVMVTLALEGSRKQDREFESKDMNLSQVCFL